MVGFTFSGGLTFTVIGIMCHGGVIERLLEITRHAETAVPVGGACFTRVRSRQEYCRL